ncbi:uncharacterized protein (DUF1697 family) [Arthrobacter sp. CG_A4]|nr:uncharacterized protein (DUF1697 family) [Arthrobacter sp. CG_A4]
MLATERAAVDVKKEFEVSLRETFGYDAWVVVLAAERVTELVAACPYPADDSSAHTYLTLGSDAEVFAELQEAGTDPDETELTRLGPEARA